MRVRTWVLRGICTVACVLALRGGGVASAEGGPVYDWHTFYGSTASDSGGYVGVDDGGNIYVAARSQDGWLGPHGEAPLHPYSGSIDFAVLKLDSNGEYLWHTFYGGSGSWDWTLGLALGPDNSVYVVGFSERGWRGDGNAEPLHPHSVSDSFDITVIKLSSEGAYRWHTFYGSGSSSMDVAEGVTVSVDGDVYTVGDSERTWQGDGGAEPLHPHSAGIASSSDVMVLKLDANGNYQWHTFYGSSSTSDGASAVAVTQVGDVYVAGGGGYWQGNGGAEPLHGHSGEWDVSLLGLTSAGAYRWHTFYGSADWDLGTGVAVDTSSNVYVAGEGRTAWLGEGGAIPIRAEGKISLLKLTSDGDYIWHTFQPAGNPGGAVGPDVVMDSHDNVVVSAPSLATWLGDGGEAPLHPYAGDQDLTVIKLGSDGAYHWHTFYGSSDREEPRGIAVGPWGSIAVAGASDASWEGDGGAEPLNPYTAEWEIVVLKLVETALENRTYLPFVSR